MKCRHRWLRKFVESKNAMGDLALFEVWFCPKCNISTTGEFKGTIKQSKKNKELERKINSWGVKVEKNAEVKHG